MLTHFVFELSQNLYFVGLVLTYALWGVILKLRETRALLVQLILSLVVYFSACAASHAVSTLRPSVYSYVSLLLPIMGPLLPLPSPHPTCPSPHPALPPPPSPSVRP